MTATDRANIVRSVVRSVVNEAELVLCSGDVPSKERLSSLISMIDNTLLFTFSVPGYMPREMGRLKELKNKAYSLYLKKYGKIVQRGLDVILE